MSSTLLFQTQQNLSTATTVSVTIAANNHQLLLKGASIRLEGAMPTTQVLHIYIMDANLSQIFWHTALNPAAQGVAFAGSLILVDSAFFDGLSSNAGLAIQYVLTGTGTCNMSVYPNICYRDSNV